MGVLERLGLVRETSALEKSLEEQKAELLERFKETLERRASEFLESKSGPLTLTEAAHVLRCSVRKVHRLRKQGLIRDCARQGREGMVNRSDVLALASAKERR